MNKTNKKTEELFKDAFAGFKKQPSPRVWKSINRNLWLQSVLKLQNILIFTGSLALIIAAVFIFDSPAETKHSEPIITENISEQHPDKKQTPDNAHQSNTLKIKTEAQQTVNKPKEIIQTDAQEHTEKSSTEEKKSQTKHSEKASGRVTVKIQTENCLTDSEDKDSNIPKAAFSASEYSGCAPLTVEFTNQCENTAHYRWDFGNGQHSSEQNPTAVYSEAGVYTVVLTAENSGLERKSTTEITVHESPKADFVIAKEENIYAENRVQFANLSTHAANYLWDFGDGNQSTEKNPIHTYKTGGIYDVSLTVNSKYNCKDSSKHQNLLVKNKKYNIIFPTAFTPDPSGANDGRRQINSKTNDVFYPIVSQEIAEYNLKIFNKKGIPVFESKDPQIGWNGYHEGRLMPSGVYVYVCSGKFSNGEYFQKTGNLTLINRTH